MLVPPTDPPRRLRLWVHATPVGNVALDPSFDLFGSATQSSVQTEGCDPGLVIAREARHARDGTGQVGHKRHAREHPGVFVDVLALPANWTPRSEVPTLDGSLPQARRPGEGQHSAPGPPPPRAASRGVANPWERRQP